MQFRITTIAILAASLALPVFAQTVRVGGQPMFPTNPSLTPPKISRTLSDLYGVPAARVALHPRHAGVTR